MESLGKRLQRLRSIKNFSQSDIAKIIGVSPSTYREWEQGRQIKGEPYEKLASIFEVTLTELITGKKTEIEVHIAQIESCVKNIKCLL
jgi:transcriptional regulator with XRE-family HTH domain